MTKSSTLVKDSTRETELLERLRDCVVSCDIENAQKACEDALEAGVPPYKTITDGLSKGMEIVGKKYESGEFFLSDLLMAGQTMKEAMRILGPRLTAGDVKGAGTVALGTVQGDLHDLGKNLVAMLLEAAGFLVVDLGVDVSTEQFVTATRDHKVNILGMSALLTTTMQTMEATIKRLEESELREKTKVILGGAPLSSEYGRQIGADAVGRDAIHGVNICKLWQRDAAMQPG